MIDLHSHILPCMDDGSQSLDESLRLLGMLARQGVDTVAATPHFYADRESAGTFLQRRKKALIRLQPYLGADVPRILPGAEVSYYPGITKLPELERLCIGGSRLLLLEMPMSRWSEYVLKELTDASSIGALTLVLAHVERCMDYQSSGTLRRLSACGILMQCNAGFFYRFRTKRNAMAMLRRGEIAFIGSDCHNLASRPPCIGRAYDSIRKKLGEDFLDRFNGYGHSVLGL